MHSTLCVRCELRACEHITHRCLDSLRYILADASEGVGDVCIISYILRRCNEAPQEGIRMKLSINSGCQRNGFMLLVQALTQYLCGGSSFARRFCRQTFCGGTGLLEKTAQGEFRLKDGVHPSLSRGLEMPDNFEHTQFPLFLHPHRRTHLWVERIREQNEQHAAIEIT